MFPADTQSFLFRLLVIIGCAAVSLQAVELQIDEASVAEGIPVRIHVRTGRGVAQRVAVFEGSRVLATGLTGLTGEAELTVSNLMAGEHLLSAKAIGLGNENAGVRAVVTILGEPMPKASSTEFWLTRTGQLARRRVTVFDGAVHIDGTTLGVQGVQAALAVDWDLDGNTDLALVGEKGLMLALGKTDGAFSAPIAMTMNIQFPGVVTNVLAGDWNLDGHPDLLVGTTEGIRILQGTGAYGLEAGNLEKGYRLMAGELDGDWNGDGKGDVFVVAVTNGEPTLAVWLGDGRGGFFPIRLPDLDGSIAAWKSGRFAAVDLDKDGRPDVLSMGGADGKEWHRNGDRLELQTGKARGIRAVAGEIERASTIWGNSSFGTILRIAGTGSNGFSGDGGAATSGVLSSPEGLALDRDGNVYIADTLNFRVRKITAATRTIETIAGTGTSGEQGDGGSAKQAVLLQPKGVAVDGAGNVYVAEYGAGRIRKILQVSGLIVTVAGNGWATSGGDGLPATAAQLFNPYAVAVDGAGNVYISEMGSHKIRKVEGGTGIIRTIAGNGTAGYSGDNGPAESATIFAPAGISVDDAGTVYFADSGNNRIRRIDGSSGVITTIAGNGTAGMGGEGIASTSGPLAVPTGVAVDAAGAVYFAEFNGQRVRRVANGIITTVAGSGSRGNAGDGGPATAAQFNGPTGVAVDASGNIYIADTSNHSIRMADRSSPYIELAGSTLLYGEASSSGSMAFVTTPAGTPWTATKDASWLTLGSSSGAGSGAVSFSFSRNTSLYSRTSTVTLNGIYRFEVRQAGAAASLTAARSMVAGTAGSGSFTLNIGSGVAWTAEARGNWITVSPASGSGPSTITYTYSANGGTAARIGTVLVAGRRFSLVQVGTTGNYSPHGILGPGIITTIAGTGPYGTLGDGGPATAAQIQGGVAMTTDGEGNLYIANGNRIRKIDAATGIIDTIAGTGVVGFSGDGGLAKDAAFNGISGLAFDGKGNMYVADLENNRIRKIAVGTGIITTIAGNGNRSSKGDGGLGTLAELNYANKVAADGLGNVYVSEYFGLRVRQIHGETGVIRTVAGTGARGVSGDGGLAIQSNFNGAVVMAVEPNGDLLIPDGGSGRVRKVNMATGVLTSVAGNGTYTFSGDGGPATSAGIDTYGPASVTVTGEWFLGSGSRVRRVSTNGIIDTAAGFGGLPGASGDGGLATSAQVMDSTIVTDAVGNLYLDSPVYNDYKIRFISFFTPQTTLGAAQGTATATAGTGTVSVTTSVAGAGWAAISNTPWLTVPPSGQGGVVTYQYAENTGLARSGTLWIGGVLFTVNQAAGTLPSVVPASLVTPVGSPQTLTFAGRDPDGRGNIYRMYFQIGTSPTSTPNSCGGYYERATDGLYLFNDAGSAVLGPVTPGSAATLQNSQCVLQASGSSVPAGSGTDLTLNLNLSLSGSYATTPQKVWFSLQDNEGHNTGWAEMGTWMPASFNRPPSILSFAPTVTAEPAEVFTISLRDPDGYSNFSRVSFLISTTASPTAGSCYGYYERATNAFFLYNWALSSAYGPIPAGSPNGSMNDYCALNGNMSVANGSNGTDITIRVSFSLFAVLGASQQKIFVSVRDIDGNDTGWVQSGIWNKVGSNAKPTVQGMSPTAPVGPSQLLSFFTNDANGYANIARIDFLVSTSSIALANACWGSFDRASNRYYLVNDAGNAAMGPLISGVPATIENSQCVFTSDTYMSETHANTGQSFRMPVTLKPAFAASAHTIYARVYDNEGNDSGWVQTGTWAATILSQQPSVVAGTPPNLSGNPSVFSFTGRDPNGFSDIQRIYFLIKSSANGNGTATVTAGSCHGFYDRVGNALFLYNDALTQVFGPLKPGSAGKLQNSACAVDGAASSVVPGAGTDLTVKIAVSAPNPTQLVGYVVFGLVADSANNSSGWIQTANWQVGPTTGNSIPTIVSSTPPAPSGSPQTFSVVIRDGDGYSNLRRVYFLVNGNATVTTNSCHGYYDLAANSYFLYNDALTAFSGPLSPGSAGTLQNSQCVISGNVSTPVAGVATDLTMTLGMNLTGSFGASTKNVYIWAMDLNENGTGWQSIATWGAAPPAQPPSFVSANPAEATGSPQKFTFAVRDPNGYATLQRVYFVVNTSATVPSNTCHGYYDRPGNGFFLYDDSLSAVSGPLTPGSSGNLENGQCRIDGATSSPITGAGTDLTVTLGLTLKTSFGGTAKNVYLWVTDSEGNGTGWVSAVTWLPPVSNQPPSVVSAAPVTATGSPQTFSIVARDPNGVGNLQRVYFVVNQTASVPAGSCHGYYDRALNVFFLYNDSLTSLLGPLTPGSQATLQNSQCTLNGATSTRASATGTDLTVTLGLSLSGAFGSASKNVYLWVTDTDGNGTGWVQGAAWNPVAPAQPPSIVSGTPANVTGSPQVFTFGIRDLDGVNNLQRVYFVVNGSATVPSNTCHGYYDRAANGLFLYNDGLTSSLGPLTPGSGGTLQNSQCILAGSTSSPVVGSGTDLTLTLGLSLSSQFGAVSKDVYLWATDYEGNGTGWVKGATWNPATADQPPVLLSNMPAAPTGTPQTFTVTARDANGVSNLQRVYFLVHTDPTIPPNTCHGYFDISRNAHFLYSDGLTTVSGPLTPGSSGEIQNSQCAIQGITSSPASGSGTDLTVGFGLSLKGSFATSSKKLFVWITDNGGNGTGWVQASNWALP